MSDELWAYVSERAAKREITTNAWITRMVRRMMEGRLVEVAAAKEAKR